MEARTGIEAGERAARARICELCRLFYQLGWVTGTGGGISIRDGDRIYMAPSGVQKERLDPEDIFVLDAAGDVVSSPGRGLRISACKPLFLHAYDRCGAGAVIHTHSLNAVLASRVSGAAFHVSGLEMQKGIEGHTNTEALEVPVIENRPHEAELTDDLAAAIRAFPRTRAVLVRNHGAYIWGRNWIEAKTQAECYDFLFAAAVRLFELDRKP